mmetsp:Transcript_8461/g.24185  ORF Transcript_8461/g.24185 Transcript_8461/m.24185 type:complete len:355 (-) Transcript_8461:84-1148(-)
MGDIKQLHDRISCHAWNGDFTRLAVCPNNTKVIIYRKNGDNYELEHTLEEHDQLVTGIDWAAKSNRIVTCGQDRNAYVWKFDNGVWKPTLVILRINRAATHVRWSPNEDKFAVASGAKLVSICYFEKDNDWWVSKHIRKHDSTVFKVDWHPNNVLLATASADNNARVVSAFIRGVDKKPGDTAYGARLPFGELFATYPARGWMHAVKWSPSGDYIAFCSHDSTVTIMDTHSGEPTVLKLKELPLCDLVWVNENTLVGAGHNFFPRTFVKDANGWTVGKNLDEQQGTGPQKTTGTRAAFSMFQNKVETGQNTNQTKLKTKHQNYVNCVQGAAGSPGNYTQVSTTSLDGKLVLWKP